MSEYINLKKLLIDIESEDKNFTSSELENILTKIILNSKQEKKPLNNKDLELLNVKIRKIARAEQQQQIDHILALMDTYNNQSQSRMNHFEEKMKDGFGGLNSSLEDIKKTLKTNKESVELIQQKTVIYDETLEYIETEIKPIAKIYKKNQYTLENINQYMSMVVKFAGFITASIVIYGAMRYILTLS
jgi:archaellum component FlaC